MKLKSSVKYALYLLVFQHLLLGLLFGAETDWFLGSFILAILSGLVLISPKLPKWE